MYYPIKRNAKHAQEIPEKIQNLVIRLKEQINEHQEQEIKDILINEFMNMARKIGLKYIRRLGVVWRSKYSDDIISEAYLGLLRGIQSAKDKLRDCNIIGYLIANIHGQVSNYLRKEFKTKDPSFLEKVSTPNLVIDHRLEVTEYQELVDKLIKSDLESQIIKYKLEGYTDEEIGEKVNLSHQRINIVKLRIGKRLLRILK